MKRDDKYILQLYSIAFIAWIISYVFDVLFCHIDYFRFFELHYMFLGVFVGIAMIGNLHLIDKYIKAKKAA